MPTWTEERARLAALAKPAIDVDELLARAPRSPAQMAAPQPPVDSEPAGPGVFRRRASVAKAREERAHEDFWKEQGR